LETEYLEAFQSIYDFLRGCGLIISFEKVDLYLLIANQLEIEFLQKIDQQFSKTPETVEDALKVLQEESEGDSSFEIAVSILAQNLSTNFIITNL
jgi:hypothetical protein